MVKIRSSMDILPPPTPPNDAALHQTSSNSHPPSDTPPEPNAGAIDGKLIRKQRKKKNSYIELPDNPPPPSSTSSSSSCCSSSSSHGAALRGGFRVSNNRRKNPRVLISSVRHKESDVDALALPLGMSIAAFVAQVLERKDAAGEMMSVDNLSKVSLHLGSLWHIGALREICTLAVAESLDNVFGNKFDGFVRNFEKSFQSTLMTLRLINESSQNNGKQQNHLSNARNSDNRERHPTSNSQESSLQEIHEIFGTDLSHHELGLHNIEINQQLTHVSPNILHSGHSSISQHMLSTMEKSVIEQARFNDLKTFEIGLLMKNMKLKETQLALNRDSYLLERFKLSMAISKASFRAEKFQTELEETRHAELLGKCLDCLVAGLLVMLTSIAYGTYVYSHQRITEATESCIPSKDSSSWWMPKAMTSFNSGLQILRCQVQVIRRILFSVLMIVAFTYLLLQRSSSSKQIMPITFILLLLGVACGFTGKLCIDTLGGNGYHWLFYWEILCLLHFFSNVFISALFVLLYGPVNVSERRGKDGKLFPHWIRRFLYYGITLLILPMLCGLIPFAGFGDWKDHFSLLLKELLQPMRIE